MSAEFAYKKCGPIGRWEGKEPGNYTVPQGWTNYSDCYSEHAKRLYEKHSSCMTTEVSHLNSTDIRSPRAVSFHVNVMKFLNDYAL